MSTAVAISTDAPCKCGAKPRHGGWFCGSLLLNGEIYTSETCLERQGTSLLHNEPNDPAPAYSEAYLERREQARYPRQVEYYLAQECINDAKRFTNECWQLILDCADRQQVNHKTMRYLRYLAYGCSYRRVAELCETTHSKVSRAVDDAAIRIRLDPRYDLYQHLAETFHISVATVRHYCEGLLGWREFGP